MQHEKDEVEELLTEPWISYQWSQCPALGISSARKAAAGVGVCMVQMSGKISEW